jgi:hypothetical protein
MDISYASSLSKTDALALRYGEDSIPAADRTVRQQ